MNRYIRYCKFKNPEKVKWCCALWIPYLFYFHFHIGGSCKPWFRLRSMMLLNKEVLTKYFYAV